MLERRVRDFRLDSRLKTSCQATILELCSDLGDVAVTNSYDSSVANCLQVINDLNPTTCQA
jgi:Golgi apparatus protein 1